MPITPLYATSPVTRYADLCAVGLSTLCLMHCLALPLLVIILPAISQFSENEVIHRALVAITVPISLSVMWQSLGDRTFRLFIITTLSGLLMLLLAAFYEPLFAYEKPLTISGALLLGFAHFWRWRHSDHLYEIHE